MPGQGETADCKQEGKQDRYKKLQADPDEFSRVDFCRGEQKNGLREIVFFFD